ncbi:hypothetical protein MMPV_008377 [Pyropia vietnamensis]
MDAHAGGDGSGGDGGGRGGGAAVAVAARSRRVRGVGTGCGGAGVRIGTPAAAATGLLTLLVLLVAAAGTSVWGAPMNGSGDGDSDRGGGGRGSGGAPPLVDAAKYREQLLSVVAAWDGGAVAATDAASTRYHVNLRRDWSRVRPKDSTVIAQARGVYINAEAAVTARAAGDARRGTLAAAARTGALTLLTRYFDASDGGVYYDVADGDDGAVVDATKDGYGNAHALFALAHAVPLLRAPERVRALVAARRLLAYMRRSLTDREGGILTRAGDGDGDGFTRSIDPLTHYFEALLAYYDVLPDGAERAAVAAEATRTGTFIVRRAVVAEAGDAGSAYVAYNYNTDWTPTTSPYSRGTQWTTAATATPPHGMELAFLLSRAEQRGLAPAGADWVATGIRLIRYAEKYAFDSRGWLRWEVTAYDGSPLGGNPDNGVYVWWAESEAARCFLHFAVARGRRLAYTERWRTAEAALGGAFTDATYGGWYRQLRVSDLKPDGTPKWDRWKVAYHYTMLHMEALRLAGRT